jgi:hypothetical protein
MKLHDQRDHLQQTIVETHDDLHALIGQLTRKIAQTYPDGTRDNRVNVETDVLPALRAMQRHLAWVCPTER